jgi:hypothetical protein
MPTYDLKNTKTGEIKEMILSISKKEDMVASGEWEQVHLGVADLVSHTGNIINKTSGDWKSLMNKMKKEAGGNSDLSSQQKKKYGFVDNTIKS